MAFLYPKLFPEDFGCVQEVNYNPSEIRIDDTQFFPVGVSLEKAMALVWKSKSFYGFGTNKYPVGDCITFSTPIIFTLAANSFTVDPNPFGKMSDIICQYSYSPNNFYFQSTSLSYECNGTIVDNIHEMSFSLIPYLGIYLYNNLYYLPVSFSFGFAVNLDDENATLYAGNITIDGTIFPLYVEDPITFPPGVTPEANFTLTTTSEREAN